MKIEIIENSNACVKVQVNLSRRRFASDPKEEANLNTIINFLRENGINWPLIENSCETKGLLIANYTRKHSLEGVWVFAKPARASGPKPTPSMTKKGRKRAATKKTTTGEEGKLLGTENVE